MSRPATGLVLVGVCTFWHRDGRLQRQAGAPGPAFDPAQSRGLQRPCSSSPPVLANASIVWSGLGTLKTRFDAVQSPLGVAPVTLHYPSLWPTSTIHYDKTWKF